MQIANNNQIEDFVASGQEQTQVFEGKNLELKFFLRTKEEFRKFLENKEHIKDYVSKVRSNLKFGKIICRFNFRDYKPTIIEQKSLIDFQDGIFDELNVQMVGSKFNDFKEICEYAKNKTNKNITTLVDSILQRNLTLEIINYLANLNPTNTRWLYHNIESFGEDLVFISDSMARLGLSASLTGCRKRFGGKTEFKNLDVSTICKTALGFKSCCLDYRPANKDKKKGQKLFATEMDVFNEKNYEWSAEVNNHYRENRTNDYLKLDKTRPSKEEAIKVEKFKRLVNFLEQMNQ